MQMIAHGFVVVGLISDIIFRRYETRTIAEMDTYTITTICFDVLTFSISFSCSSYYFQLCWSLRSYTAYRKLMYGLPFGNDYHLGRLLHVENVPASNARRNEYKNV
jgi:hypothetical protein